MHRCELRPCLSRDIFARKHLAFCPQRNASCVLAEISRMLTAMVMRVSSSFFVIIVLATAAFFNFI
jgi:hypothetical protein